MRRLDRSSRSMSHVDEMSTAWSPRSPLADDQIHRYRLGAQHVAGKRVLTLGASHGALLLSRSASLVIAVTPDSTAHDSGQLRRVAPNLHLVGARWHDLPLAAHAVDVIVDLDLVIALALDDACIVELKRVLRADGLLILATTSLGRSGIDPVDSPPVDDMEIAALPIIRSRFRHVLVQHQHLMPSSLVTDAGASRDALTTGPAMVLLATDAVDQDPSRRQRSLLRPSSYRLVFCSDREIPSQLSSVLLDNRTERPSDTLDRERQRAHIDTELKTRLAAWEAHRDRLEASPIWRAVERAQQIRYRIMPPGSIRDRLWAHAARRLRARSGARFAEMPYRSVTARGPHQQSLSPERRQASIAVVIAVGAAEPAPLAATLASIRRQTRAPEQICIAVASEALDLLQHLLDGAAALYPGLRLATVDGADAATLANAAAELATTDLLIFLEPGDHLAVDALVEIGAAVERQPAADLVYGDEDRLLDSGERIDPWCKPDWSPELLLSVNYLAHPVVRRTRFNAFGAFDPSAHDAHSWDFALRCVEHLDPGTIVHLPRVLVHRAAPDAVMAHLPTAAERRVLEAHLRRRGIRDPEVTVEAQPVPRARARWASSGGRVSIIIPTKDRIDVLKPCLDSILHLTAYPDIEIILVDSGSTDPTTYTYYAALTSDPRVRIIDFAGAFNYSAANNLGADHATGDMLLFLNNDVEALEPDWLEELVRWAERPEIGVVGAKLLFPYHRVQHAGIIVGLGGHADHVFAGAPEGITGPFGSVEWYRNYHAVTGACLMVRRALFEEIGRFDEDYLLTFSDVELCVRLVRAGHRALYTPFARLIHHEGISRGKRVPMEDMVLAYDHLAGIVASGDAYFNRNLSSTALVPRLARGREEPSIDRLRRIIVAAGGPLLQRSNRPRPMSGADSVIME